MEKIIVAALAANNIIGNKEKIPWHSAEDLKYFKKTTYGYPVIMGRKTFESIGKPLEGRQNIVISKTKTSFNGSDNILVFNSLEKAYIFCQENLKTDIVFIIGGGSIFKQTIKDADKMFISRMKNSYEGDVYFPSFSEMDWLILEIKNYNDFNLITYIRKPDNHKNSRKISNE